MPGIGVCPDRRSYLTAEYGSSELVSSGMDPISPVSWTYPGDNELNPYDYGLDEAAELLDEAGWTDIDEHRLSSIGWFIQIPRGLEHYPPWYLTRIQPESCLMLMHIQQAAIVHLASVMTDHRNFSRKTRKNLIRKKADIYKE